MFTRPFRHTYAGFFLNILIKSTGTWKMIKLDTKTITRKGNGSVILTLVTLRKKVYFAVDFAVVTSTPLVMFSVLCLAILTYEQYMETKDGPFNNKMKNKKIKTYICLDISSCDISLCLSTWLHGKCWGQAQKVDGL